MKVTPDLIEISLGRKADGYLLEQLAEGRSLSKLAARRLNLNNGSAKTFLPKSTSWEEVLRFREGHKIRSAEKTKKLIYPDGSRWTMVPVASNLSGIVPCLVNFLSGDMAMLICEDFLTTRKDLSPGKTSANTLLFKDEVYRCLSSRDSSPESVKEVIRDCADFRFVGIGCKARIPPMNLVEADLEAIANVVELVVTLAYDGEGYLIWQKASNDRSVPIFVQLLNEGTFVARPTRAIPRGENLYEILPTANYGKVDEEWEFKPGTIVRGIMRHDERGDYLFAVER